MLAPKHFRGGGNHLYVQWDLILSEPTPHQIQNSA